MKSILFCTTVIIHLRPVRNFINPATLISGIFSRANFPVRFLTGWKKSPKLFSIKKRLPWLLFSTNSLDLLARRYFPLCPSFAALIRFRGRCFVTNKKKKKKEKNGKFTLVVQFISFFPFFRNVKINLFTDPLLRASSISH